MKDTQTVKRGHLFNEYTDRCFFCDVAAEDSLFALDAVCQVATEESIKRAPVLETDDDDAN